MLYIGRVGRKTIFVLGAFTMSVTLFFCGLSVVNQWHVSSLVMICIFIMAFQLSTGSVVYIYVPEVAVDRATGLAVAV